MGASTNLARLRWRFKKSATENSAAPSLDFILSENSNSSNRTIEVEVWLIDVLSGQHTEILPSIDWLEGHWKRLEKNQIVWHRFAGLKPLWRNAILGFLAAKNKSEDHEWGLYHVDIPQRWSRTSLFGHQRNEQLVYLMISRRKSPEDDDDTSEHGSKSDGNTSLPKYPSPKPRSRLNLVNGQSSSKYLNSQRSQPHLSSVSSKSTRRLLPKQNSLST